jgi:hypothetical protein
MSRQILVSPFRRSKVVNDASTTAIKTTATPDRSGNNKRLPKCEPFARRYAKRNPSVTHVLLPKLVIRLPGREWGLRKGMAIPPPTSISVAALFCSLRANSAVGQRNCVVVPVTDSAPCKH